MIKALLHSKHRARPRQNVRGCGCERGGTGTAVINSPAQAQPKLNVALRQPGRLYRE
jgi:hypothetical protein